MELRDAIDFRFALTAGAAHTVGSEHRTRSQCFEVGNGLLHGDHVALGESWRLFADLFELFSVEGPSANHDIADAELFDEL